MGRFLCAKKLLRLEGNPSSILTGLSSQLPEAPATAFLNQHGRIVAVCEQCPDGEDAFFLIAAEKAVAGLEEHLARYLRLNGSRLEVLAHHVYLETDLESDRNNDIVIALKAGRLRASAADLPCNMDDAACAAWRLSQAMPWHMIDYTNEMVLNVDLSLVSTTKGCYLGQEPVAKVLGRAKPSLKLIPVWADELPPEQRERMTSIVVDPASGRSRGFAFVSYTSL